MNKYDLSHLTQNEKQIAIGPIQDDEALFLYSIIRGSLLKNILEIGGLSGYSAQNFLKALEYRPNNDGKVFTVDFNETPKLSENHIVLVKNALDITSEDLHFEKIDLLFFDCHDMIQMDVYNKLIEDNLIDDKTIIALHDTNLHFEMINGYSIPYRKIDDGYVHQEVERNIVNMMKDLGYDIFSIETTKERHLDTIPFRHGISVCKKFKKFI